ncbi:MAG: tetratricopeptide repeat protein [Chloroflexota bacterium]
MEEPPLELLLLGPLQISIAGRPVLGLVSLKAKALLAYLATERRPVPRSTLAGLLWSDLPEEDARRNLRVEISKLRRFLAPYLVLTHHEALFKPDASCLVDLYEFQKHLAAASKHLPAFTPEQFQKVVNLYRDDFLSGMQVRAAPLFEEWLVLERERQRQAALTLLDRLVETAIQQGDWENGLLAARKSISIDSWREQSHRLLMNLLALSGDRSAALAQFEATRRLLVQELGIEPGSETLALYQRIKAGVVIPLSGTTPVIQVSTPPPPHNLPASTSSFVGREFELEQLGELLGSPDCRLLTLTGAGGTGKTRLALEFCWRLLAAGATFKDGVFFIPLAAVGEGTFLPAAIANALKLPDSPDPRQLLLQHLRSKQLLLVLDNFEHLAEFAHLLVELLQGAPRLKLLVTSRHQLNLYEEWIFPLEGLPFPSQNDLTGWRETDAVQLFEQRARRVNLRFALEDHRDYVVHLCQILEGLPLGIELAAAWVNALPCQNILRLIEANLALPEPQIRNLPARQRSLRAVFQYSWDLLSCEEQNDLSRLTVFQGGFTAEAAETALDVSPRLLASLVAKSLLRFSPNGRYEMHNLLHSFASEKLSPADRQQAQAAHSVYFGHFLIDRSREFAGPEEAQAIAAIGTEIANIRVGWQWALTQIPATLPEAETHLSEGALNLLAQYIPILSTFFFRKSWFREAELLFARAADRLEAAGFGNLQPATRAPFILGILYLAHARHCRPLGQTQLARTQLTKSLHLLALSPDSAELADAWHNLGQIEQQSGAFPTAEEAYQRSLHIYRMLEQPTGITSNLISLGVLAKNRGDFDQATCLYSECMQIFEQRGDQRGIWTCLINLGNIANVQGNYMEALRLYKEAHLNVQQAGDLSRQALTLVNLGSVAREINDTDTALQYYQVSLRLSEEIGEIRIQVASLDGLGKTHLNRGDLGESGDYLKKAMKIALEANLLPQALDSLASFGQLAFQSGSMQPAISILSYVLAQTYCPNHVRQSAQKELSRISAQMADEAFVKAEREFQGLSLEKVMDRLI